MKKTLKALVTGTTVLLTLSPLAASAESNAALGGGNALARALGGQSQGIVHANLASDLLAHLTLASTRGGRPDDTPPSHSNAGGNDGNTNEPSQNNPNAIPVNPNGDGNENGNDNNGGPSSGNGGNGGNASPGGLVRAGSVVTNATALNVINANIVRISLR
ncbi:hypothetical protein HY968_02315 [Candidatus Kaiserbacteria bacterium]|nr:hypothetical protein [Candidatus Kaiserbacteria bacterium]